ncbi:MAG TPA: hypothetical protein VFS35_07305, partial [Terrimicrobiaceae bacterium]|nr:hypothetical protein [Terrimicrobiaceae bacterium]
MTKKLPDGSERKVPAGGRVLMIGLQTQSSPVVLDISKLVVGMREDLRRLLREDIQFDLALLTTGGCLVTADPGQMHELILHLVLDARDAMPDGGSLQITVERKRI